MVYMMDNSLPFEVDREKEFAPVKNATGTDSVETARALLAVSYTHLDVYKRQGRYNMLRKRNIISIILFWIILIVLYEMISRVFSVDVYKRQILRCRIGSHGSWIFV